MNSSGNFVWAKGIGGADSDEAFGIAKDSNGNIYTTGIFSGTTDFDPSAGTFNLVSAGLTDILVSKFEKLPIFVKSNASGANNGISWADAYTDLQSALSITSSGDEIWVAAGTYKPTTGTDRTVSFALKNGVAVYGGFAGTETLRAQHNPAANVTTLSGEIGAAGIADNSYHVVDNGINNTAVLDGFTISSARSPQLSSALLRNATQ